MCNIRVVVSLGNGIKQLAEVRLNSLGVASLREYNMEEGREGGREGGREALPQINGQGLIIILDHKLLCILISS